MLKIKSLRKTNIKKALHVKRKCRVRLMVKGTAQSPRLSVFKSAKHIYVQAIDDLQGSTLASASTVEKEIASGKNGLKKMQAAAQVGILLGKRLVEKGITSAVFDRNGFRYTGRVASVANGAREAGVKF